MAKIHLLRAQGPNRYQAVVHAAVPAGNNSAGVAWSDVIKGAGLNTSILAVGTGPGQITQPEMDQITNGALIEAVLIFEDNPALTVANRLTYLDMVAQQSVDQLLARLAEELKFFGMTRS